MKKKFLKLFISLIIIWIVIMVPLRIYNNLKINRQIINKLKKGTPKNEVLKIFGQPHQWYGTSDSTETLIYLTNTDLSSDSLPKLLVPSDIIITISKNEVMDVQIIED